MRDIIPVAEIFESFQGEGPIMGRRALFIRVSGCNLVGKCKYCDTDFRVREILTPEQIAKRINDYVTFDSLDNWVVITGGEPMIYQDKLVNVFELVENPEIIEYQIETNGLIRPNISLLSWIKYIVVSPKKQWFRQVIDNYKRGLVIRRKTHFKFVVGNIPNDDIVFWRPDEVKRAIIEMVDKYNFKKDRIWLMPFGATVDELDKNSKLVWNLAKELNVNYSDRIHVRVWKKLMRGM